MAMTGNTDIQIIQQNITTYIQMNDIDSVDALKLESLQDGAYHLVLYRGGKQITLLFTKPEFHSYILKG